MVISIQPRDKLENRRSQNDEMPTTIWKEYKAKRKKERKVATLEEEKVVRWVIDNKKDWRREKEIEANYRKIEKMVLQKFLK